jgi:hypothetical protein
MMDEIICQQCGHTNPIDAVFCQRCGALLPPSRPATDQLAPTLRAGEEPQKKSTSELEPLLPAWLREMRKGEESPPAPKEEKSAPPPPPSSQPSVAAEAEEEEIPEWLKELGILSCGPGKAQPLSFSEKEGKEEESAAPQEGWSKDLGPLFAPGSVTNAFETGLSAGAEPEAEASSMLFSADELPAWLRGEAQPAAPPAEEPVLDWLKAFAEEPPTPAAPAEPAAPTAEEPVPDWLKAFAEEPPTPAAPAEPAAPPAEEPVPDWLKAFAEEPPVPAAPAEPAAPPAEEPVPDWLKAFAEEPPAPAAPAQPAVPTAEEPVPDWLKAFAEEPPAPATPAQPATPPAEEPVPDWLKAFAEEPPAPAAPAEPAAPPAEEPVPDWLKAFAEEPPAPAAPAQPVAPTAEEPVPDWLKAFAEEPLAPAAPAEPVASTAEEPVPDWLKAFAEETPGTPQASQPPSTPAVIGASGAGEEDLISLLEMEIPDWLAGISAEATSSQPAAEETPALEAAELPAWVQAMRPLEAILSSEAEGAASLEEEKEGPLAGLRGVLPRAPETLPYTRPRTYSVRLNVTQDHQAHVQLLEQLIAAESQPRPRQATPAQKSGRFGYWLIAILLLAAILLPLFGGTQMTAMPALIPRGTWQFIESFNALPASPTILLVLDYEMSTSGEMEALLLPPLRHLTSIKQAHLAFIALNPLMSTMDERLLESLHVAQPQMPLPESVNLGYLPGGLSALPLFASNPTFAASPEARARWERSPFQRVKTLSDFDCVVLVTDNAESARLWIEQTSSLKYTLLMVSSARSAPMLSPYFYSGQAKGMIAGLNDAAAYEQMSGLSGLARRYRDAYSAGLLLALGAGGIGALWGLLMRRNSKPQEGA